MSSPMLSPKYASKSRPQARNRQFKKRKHRDPFLVSTSHQTGRSRRNSDERQKPEKWRHNLAALSHRHNLYVVAHKDELHVFEPQYPTQKIANRASLTIQLPVSRPNLRGHIRSDRPHSVNHLLIALLGEQEIVLCACDDGDVLAYTTGAIMSAVKRRGYPDNAQDRVADELRPFFHAHVCRSAWGLAVHTAARKIAISANTHKITVFSFALSGFEEGSEDSLSDTDSYSPPQARSPSSASDLEGDDEYSGSEDSGSNDSHYSDSEASGHSAEGWISHYVFANRGWKVQTEGTQLSFDRTAPRRNKNVCSILDVHNANIPTVSFHNSSEDPDGQFLLSADIIGRFTIWDLDDMTPVLIFDPTSSLRPFGAWNLGGWAVHWLDRRAFRKTEPRKAFWSGSQFCALPLDNRFVNGPEKSVISIAGPRSMPTPTETWNPPLSKLRHSGSDVAHGQDSPDDAIEEDIDSADETSSDADIMEDTNMEYPPRSIPPQSRRAPHRRPMPGAFSATSPFVSPNETLVEDASRNPHFHWSPGWPGPDNVKQWPASSSPLPLPNCPIVLARPTSLNMFQSPNMADVDRSHPFITLDDPLHQDIPVRWQDDFHHIDRMSLTVSLPELGVFLAGSPKGRVAVLTLHQLDNPFSHRTTRPLYTMRLDAVIPSPPQEQAGMRPLYPLVGLSAGPVQGFLDGEPSGVHGHRRWRVLLLYRDESVLSYEMWRRGDGGGEEDDGVAELCIV